MKALVEATPISGPAWVRMRALRLPGQHRTLHVADGEGQSPQPPRLAEGGQGVGGLAALADGHRHRVLAHEGRAVSELAAVVDLRRHPRHLLQEELAHEGGVPARAAGEEDDALGRGQLRGRRAQLLEVHLALVEGDARQEGVAYRLRLLVDLLEHEVAVAALFRLHGVPGDPLRGAAQARGPRGLRGARPRAVTTAISPSSRKRKSRV